MSSLAVQLQVAGSSVRAALSWWGQGLEAALPPRLIGLVAGDRRRIVVDEDEGGALVARLYRSSRVDTAVTEASLDDARPRSSPGLRTIAAAAKSRPVILRIPHAKILTQTVRAPAAALENLNEAVRFGLPTWTPFAAEDVVFHADVVEKTEEHARIRIRMVPRAELAASLERLSGAGLTTSVIAFGADEASFGAAGGALDRRLGRSARLDLALAGSAFALAIGLLAFLHFGWARQLDDLDAAIRQEAVYRTKQIKLEADLAQLETRQRAVLTKRASEPRLSAIVAELAERLPESAEVVEFEWGGATGRLRLTATEELDVAAALAASSVLTAKPERAERDGSQSFTLSIGSAR